MIFANQWYIINYDHVIAKIFTFYFCNIDPFIPIFRANPFPKVTDLFCRLPLSTLFYWPEATHLGDLMRLWVRSLSKINLSHRFSRDNRCAPDTSKSEVLYQSSNPISIQYDSRLIKIVKKKRELFPGQRLTSLCSFTLP